MKYTTDSWLALQRIIQDGVDEGLLCQAVRSWVAHVATWERRLTVERWNEAGILGSAGQPLLEALGFYRQYPVMVWAGR